MKEWNSSDFNQLYYRKLNINTNMVQYYNARPLHKTETEVIYKTLLPISKHDKDRNIDKKFATKN